MKRSYLIVSIVFAVLTWGVLVGSLIILALSRGNVELAGWIFISGVGIVWPLVYLAMLGILAGIAKVVTLQANPKTRIVREYAPQIANRSYSLMLWWINLVAVLFPLGVMVIALLGAMGMLPA